ncbi:hypothetical protein [Aporhodopirellula aestuarii]|uniref:YfhO family protein n=1 Tax=Aporhodopirellula aestuarii TaxID=2950107 RepID=A0ABT0U4H3_9BACT|nr:hypothetical protein [Aporhodopirellula aestuarii]MCM2371819.1 hypothetical protein [Aporhodopirellula aestuarii]
MRFRPVWLAPVVAPACLLVMFASVLLGRDRLAFRDVGYFYTPLYEWVAELCHAQRGGAFGGAIWNPLDQTGMPLAGETTTAVFYPLRMLVYAPPWSAETAIGVYVVLHLIIASLTAYQTARRLRCDAWSACVAGLVYPLSGIVLFSATNPPFLVGAAWLPLLLTPLIMRGCRSVVVPAIAMAMIVLGGDPPTALHAMIVAAIVHLMRFSSQLYHRRKLADADRSPANRLAAFLAARISQMAMVCTLASMLAAPQIAASVAWSARSDRVQHDATPEAFKIREQAYAFSVPPWRVAEFAVPNLYSTPWPVNARWDRIVFDGGVTRVETSLWTPSLYCGLLFPMLVIDCLVRRLLHRRRRWRCVSVLRPWGVVFVIGLVTAGGAYGPGYAVRSLFAATHWLLGSLDASWLLPPSWRLIDGQRGGPFWLLHEYFPGYDSLRYPSKWLPFVALSLAVYCAIAVRRLGLVLRYQQRRTTHRLAARGNVVGIAGMFTMMMVGYVVVAATLRNQSAMPNDPFWGPFVAESACWQLLFALAHVAVIGSILVWGQQRQWFAGRQWLVVVIALDVMIAHYDLVPRIDRAAEASLIDTASSEVQGSEVLTRWMRLHPNNGLPVSWARQSSDDRMLTVEAGLRRAGFGRWHVEHGDAVVNNMVSIGTREMAEFWSHAKVLDKEMASSDALHWRGWCRMLGVAGYLRMGGDVSELTRTQSGDVLPEVSHELLVQSQRPVDPSSDLWIQQQVVALDNDRATAWRQVLTAYATNPVDPPAFVSPDIATKFDKTESMLVSRRVYQDGYWRALLTPTDREGEPIEAQIFAVDFLSQGIVCPPGQWQIEFRYVPWWYMPLVIVALFTWATVSVILIKRCCS